MATHAVSFPFLLARHITSAVLDGLPEHFPRLRLLLHGEDRVAYIPWLMQRLDDDYFKRRHEAPLLRRLQRIHERVPLHDPAVGECAQEDS